MFHAQKTLADAAWGCSYQLHVDRSSFVHTQASQLFKVREPGGRDYSTCTCRPVGALHTHMYLHVYYIILLALLNLTLLSRVQSCWSKIGRALTRGPAPLYAGPQHRSTEERKLIRHSGRDASPSPSRLWIINNQFVPMGNNLLCTSRGSALCHSKLRLSWGEQWPIIM